MKTGEWLGDSFCGTFSELCVVLRNVSLIAKCEHALFLRKALHACAPLCLPVQSGRREQHPIVVGAMGRQSEHYLQTRQWPVSSQFFLSSQLLSIYIYFLSEPCQSQIRNLCWQTCNVSIKGFCPDFNSVRGGFQKSCAQTFAIVPARFFGDHNVKNNEGFSFLHVAAH